MNRLVGAFTAIMLVSAIVFVPRLGFTAEKRIDKIQARPPVHIRRSATTSPTGYSPKQIRHAYGFDALPNVGGQANDGAGIVIGIIDAYDAPQIAHDLEKFITHFQLAPMNGLPGTPPCTTANGPHPCFQKVFAQGKPRTDGGWALETSLDVEWAHVVAPGADILLVEARNSFLSSLLNGVDVAVNDGAKVVSMSWGGSEFWSEASYDFHFQQAGVMFTAASGDGGYGGQWPAASPYVVSVGGTTLPLDSNGNLTGAETAWSGSGGGISRYEYEPGYQSHYGCPPGPGQCSGIGGTSGFRGLPDVAYVADPTTGVAVYDSTPYQRQTGWFELGGTSVGAPQWAALIALADQSREAWLSGSSLSSSPLYDAAAPSTVYAANYRDVTSGSNGCSMSLCTASPGYDFVTGLGSPLANSLVPYLSAH